ncbi:hypothetical protein BDP27DRAFT_208687 [Rhodocollybia butyracea]|uniref:Uncharacterized protein n=1 Tax=Rhodocollybia butyracea TaxID=206335 RepID=A0A9P5U3P4_9AGAR|nr:hypothetical protein BDP27DRAFT_208687 [Rhodocollybia butyracea]
MLPAGDEQFMEGKDLQCFSSTWIFSFKDTVDLDREESSKNIGRTRHPVSPVWGGLWVMYCPTSTSGDVLVTSQHRFSEAKIICCMTGARYHLVPKTISPHFSLACHIPFAPSFLSSPSSCYLDNPTESSCTVGTDPLGPTQYINSPLANLLPLLPYPLLAIPSDGITLNPSPALSSFQLYY